MHSVAAAVCRLAPVDDHPRNLLLPAPQEAPRPGLKFEAFRNRHRVPDLRLHSNPDGYRRDEFGKRRSLTGRDDADRKPIPPPPAALKSLPVVGEKAAAIWAQADSDWPAFKASYGPQLASAGRWMLKSAAGTFVMILLLVVAVILAAVTLAYERTVREFTLRMFARITGSRASGEHYMDIVGATVRSVANGVIGVAFVQALLCGIGFFLVGIPGAGILSLLAMVIGVVQVPVVIVTLPAIIYAFAVKSTTVAILFTVWFIVAGLSDAVLKPLLIGHGLEVPMPVILLGVIGGVMAYGLVGLFIGAVLLAVGYVLLKEWLDSPATEDVPAKPRPRTLRAAE